MKLPRDIAPEKLIHALSVLGYRPTRQTGSHVRITTETHEEHHEVIPMEHRIKVGTLHAILASIAKHHGLSVDDLLSMLEL